MFILEFDKFMKKILVIYSCAEFPTRQMTLSHIYCFSKYPNALIYYTNFFFAKVPFYLRFIDFDVIIYHNSLTGTWNMKRFLNNLKTLKKYKFINSKKVALFQDEYFNTDLLCKFINELNINQVFSVAPKTEWPKIYSKINLSKIKITQVLTGYIDEKFVEKVNKFKIKKTIDIGYRTVWNNAFSLGKFGLLKSKIAEVFQKNSPKFKLNTDISCLRKDIITGDEWYKFLAKCKYTIGCESGASLLDADGSINKKINNYLKINPNASFEDVQSNCLKGLDGNLNLKAISPRHFEACITKTCQVLVEGDYNRILKPMVHYIPIKKDFSNINKILNDIKIDKLRTRITDAAYKDIIISNNYTYNKFINVVLNPSLFDKKLYLNNYTEFMLKLVNSIQEFYTWCLAFFYAILTKLYFRILK